MHHVPGNRSTASQPGIFKGRLVAINGNISFFVASSLSNSVAVATIFSFSLKRRAVSLTKAKASDCICSSISSIFYLCLFEFIYFFINKISLAYFCFGQGFGSLLFLLNFRIYFG
ncbi:MAG: hypothetical protein IPP11_07465 [Chitinophagaceae bacterium]|nr:hypothetical protein [Chitinophagaceae bacterium]